MPLADAVPESTRVDAVKPSPCGGVSRLYVSAPSPPLAAGSAQLSALPAVPEQLNRE